ncbi:hypothetical protein [Brachybacterium sp.]|uniref:hypothetical protein n=1 Tax=Brachybacterium sp. TaxID=1891286 RepID=UPI002ED3E3FF
MADWTENWQDELDERLRDLVLRAQVHLDDLAVRYLALGGMVTPGRGEATGRRTPAGPSVPIRVDVVDLARDVEAFANRYAGLVAGTLRAGRSNTRSTVGALSYVGNMLGQAALADPTIATDVEGGAAKLRWRARRLVGEVSTAFPVDAPCPDCTLPSLWVHPGRGIVKCGVETCGSEWTVGDIAVPIWAASRDTPKIDAPSMISRR